MGWLQNLWHGKGHEQFDQLALGLAQMTAMRMRELRAATGVPLNQQAMDVVLDELEAEIRLQQADGMNLFGFARLMKSYADALVMLGLPRDAANELKRVLRQRITLKV